MFWYWEWNLGVLCYSATLLALFNLLFWDRVDIRKVCEMILILQMRNKLSKDLSKLEVLPGFWSLESFWNLCTFYHYKCCLQRLGSYGEDWLPNIVVFSFWWISMKLHIVTLTLPHTQKCQNPYLAHRSRALRAGDSLLACPHNGHSHRGSSGFHWARSWASSVTAGTPQDRTAPYAGPIWHADPVREDTSTHLTFGV